MAGVKNINLRVLTVKGIFFTKLFKSQKQEYGKKIEIQSEEDLLDRLRLLCLTKEEVCRITEYGNKTDWDNKGLKIEEVIKFIKQAKGIVCEMELVDCAKKICDELCLDLSTEQAKKLIILATNLVCKKGSHKPFPYTSRSQMRKLLCCAPTQNWHCPVIPTKLQKKYGYKNVVDETGKVTAEEDNNNNETIKAIITSWQSISCSEAYKGLAPEEIQQRIADITNKKVQEKEERKKNKKIKCDDSSSDSDSDSDCSSDSESDCSDSDKKKKKKKKAKKLRKLLCASSDISSSSSSSSCTSIGNSECTVDSSDCSSLTSGSSGKKAMKVDCTESDVMREIDPCEIMGTQLVCEPKINMKRFCQIWKKKGVDAVCSDGDMRRAFKECNKKEGCTPSKANDIAKDIMKKKSRSRSSKRRC